MPYIIRYEWKSFKISVTELSKAIRAMDATGFAGVDANSLLGLVFETKPSDKVHDFIQQYLDSLTEETEAVKLKRESDMKNAETTAKELIPYQDIFSLIPAEKKLLMSLQLNDEDREALLQKYPQV